jgi:hypothetical protein
MTRLTPILVALAVATTSPQLALAKKNKSPLGVFGTINSKTFKATSRDGVGDDCVRGIYNPSLNILTFYAFECKAKRRRQGAYKKNYKGVVISCQPADASAPVGTPPVQLVCPSSVYTEARTGRFGIPVSQTDWIASTTFDPMNGTISSSLNTRIDSFDGTTIRGAFFGSFDLQGSGTPAQVSDEVRFEFPIEVQ